VASAAADIFRRAAALNVHDTRRNGNVVALEGGLDVIVTGDIHGNRAALSKVIAAAGIGETSGRRLILQEIIHGPPDKRTGLDRSVEVLLRAARLKIAHPEQVIFIMGNHDLAEATGNEITKNGVGACKSFAEGVSLCFGDEAREVLEAVRELCLSMPLAVRCANDVLITHSLPSPRRMESVGVDILRRANEQADLRRGGAVYEWTWGRGQTDEQTDELAAELGVEFFILGHRYVEAGFETVTRRAIAVASDHDRGCVVRFSTDVPLTAETAARAVTPIVSLGEAR